MLVTRELKFDATAEVKLNGRKVDLAEVPADLKWGVDYSFSHEHWTTTYSLISGGGYSASLFIQDPHWTGEGDPSTIDLADASDILNKIIAAAIAEKKTAQPA